MKIKKLISALVLGSMLVGLSGCNITDFSAENLLRPPKAVGDEAEIEQLIAKTADSGYTLKYPKNGKFRSAIIMTDLDGNDSNEAVAFFRNSAETSSVHMLVMYSKDNSWEIASDNIFETTDIDSVDFADLTGNGKAEIIVNSTTYTPNVGKLSCYSYSEGKTNEVGSGQSCSSFVTGDFDNDGTSEIMSLVLYTTENEALASMLDYNEDSKSLYAKAMANMDPNVVKYKNIAVTKLDNDITGIVVDGTSANEVTNTQVIFYSRDLAILRNPLFKEKAKNITQRSSQVICSDIDKDGKLEIPVTLDLPKQSGDSKNIYADKIIWNSFDTSKEALVAKQAVIINYDYMFMMNYADKWSENKVTAITDLESETTSFYAWNGTKLDTELFEIKVFPISEWESGKSDDFTLITKDDKYAYTFNNINPDTQISLSDDEIKTGFSTLDQSGI